MTRAAGFAPGPIVSPTFQHHSGAAQQGPEQSFATGETVALQFLIGIETGFREWSATCGA